MTIKRRAREDDIEAREIAKQARRERLVWREAERRVRRVRWSERLARGEG